MEQSQWQQESRYHDFDAYGRQLEAAKRAVIEEAAAKVQDTEAPVYNDVVYDPSHPDADWSGLVRKRNVKKHVNVPSALTPASDGNGLTTTDTARSASGKKRVAAGPASSSSSSSLLAHDGGPGARDEGWKTKAQLLAEGGTPAAEERRRRSNRRVTLPVRPEFQEPWPLAMPSPPPPSSSSAVPGEGTEEEKLVGYRAPRNTWGAQRGASLLSGLGAKLRQEHCRLSKGSIGGGGR